MLMGMVWCGVLRCGACLWIVCVAEVEREWMMKLMVAVKLVGGETKNAREQKMFNGGAWK